jgi:hypothetical protein
VRREAHWWLGSHRHGPGDTNQIRVTAHTWWSFTKPTMKTITRGNELSVNTQCGHANVGVGNSIGLTLTVPKDLVVSTSVNSSSGGVHVEDLGGTIDASSSAGSTDVLVRTDPVGDRTVTATSSAGSVVVAYAD